MYYLEFVIWLGLVCGYGRCWGGGRGSEEGGREVGRGGCLERCFRLREFGVFRFLVF